jgi:hypothetical protein
MPPRIFKGFILPALLLAALLIPTVAQSPFDNFGNFRQRRRAPSNSADAGPSFGEYTFVRTIYDSPMRGYGRRGYGYGGGGTWDHRLPRSRQQLHRRSA